MSVIKHCIPTSLCKWDGALQKTIQQDKFPLMKIISLWIRPEHGIISQLSYAFTVQDQTKYYNNIFIHTMKVGHSLSLECRVERQHRLSVSEHSFQVCTVTVLQSRAVQVWSQWVQHSFWWVPYLNTLRCWNGAKQNVHSLWKQAAV